MKWIKIKDIAKFLLCRGCELEQGKLRCSKCGVEISEH